MRPLTIWLFGRSRCETSSSEAPFPSRPRARSLFVALAFAERALERDWLAATLWPDVPDAEAGANLRRHLSYVSKWLAGVTGAPDPIVRSGSLVGLDRTAIACVDVRTFRDAVATGDFEAAARAYGGELLEDLDDAWILPERLRLRAAHADVLAHLVEGARSRLDFETALRYATVARLADPYAEDWLRTTMRVRYASGDRAGALSDFEAHRRLLARELDLEPMSETLMLADSMRRNDAPDGAAARLGDANAIESDAFVGRERERRALRDAIASGRIVTITGEPGVGKSRLALRAVRELPGGSGAATVTIEAGAASDAVHLERLAVRAIRPGSNAAAFDTLEEAAAGLESIVVFDGCERLRTECAELARRLIGASGARVVATSRIPLGLAEETVFRLGPLDPGDAARLFRARVRSSRHESLDADGDAIERICANSGGLPLAIELAAARARVSTLANVERDGRRFADRPGRDVLHAAYQSSYALLSETERAVWRRLSAFAGGWSETIALVACDGLADDKSLREAASTLVRHSLVVPPGLHDVAARYTMLDATRDFASHRAHELGESDVVARAHALAIARHYVAIGGRLRAERAADYYPEVERDLENVDAALDTLARGDARDRALATDLCLAVSRFWADQGYAREGERRLRALLLDVPSEDLRRRLELLRVAGTLARDLGDYAASFRDFSDLVRVHERAGSSAVETAKAQTMAANAARMTGDFDEALARTRAARASFEAAEEPYFAAWAVYAIGTTLLSAGRSAEAAVELERATDLFDDANATADSSSSIANLALCAYYEGRYETAAELTRESVRRASEAGHRYYYAHAILNEALIAHALGASERAWPRILEASAIALALDSLDLSISCGENAATVLSLARPAEAAALLASVDRARARAHAPRFPIDLPFDLRLRSALETSLGTARFEACLARGRITRLRDALGRLNLPQNATPLAGA